MQVRSGNGLEKIVAEEQADAASFERDHDKIENAKRHPWRYILYVLLLGTLPSLAVVAAVFMVYGRERRTAYDREYEQEPPTETAPALVPTLLRQGGEAGSYEFTATLFDLVRRGVYAAKPATTERSTWGGLRHESVADLEIRGHARRADALGERGRPRRRRRDRRRPTASLEVPRARSRTTASR